MGAGHHKFVLYSEILKSVLVKTGFDAYDDFSSFNFDPAGIFTTRRFGMALQKCFPLQIHSGTKNGDMMDAIGLSYGTGLSMDTDCENGDGKAFQ